MSKKTSSPPLKFPQTRTIKVHNTNMLILSGAKLLAHFNLDPSRKYAGVITQTGKRSLNIEFINLISFSDPLTTPEESISSIKASEAAEAAFVTCTTCDLKCNPRCPPDNCPLRPFDADDDPDNECDDGMFEEEPDDEQDPYD